MKSQEKVPEKVEVSDRRQMSLFVPSLTEEERQARKRACWIDCSGDRDPTRQEFKEEADVSTILARHGAGSVFPSASYGVTDYDLTLQEALDASREAAVAFRRLPKEIQERYGSWRDVAIAIERGELKAPEAPAGGSGGAPGASPSDSAAGGAPKGA